MSNEQKPEDSSSARPPNRGQGGVKKPFVLRLDEDTYKALEKWAADEFRSVNGQMEWIIAQALKAAGRAREARKDAGTQDGKTR